VSDRLSRVGGFLSSAALAASEPNPKQRCVMPVQILNSLAYQRSLAVRDLTDAALGPHAMQLLVQHSIEALRNAWQCPVIVYLAPPVVSIAENYDDLRYPPGGASRDARYTRYVSNDLLLRTQTSAMIPRAL